MEKPKHHIFVCGSFRVAGEPKGICHRKDSGSLLGYLETEVSDRGMDGVTVSSAGCLKLCDQGPVVVVYPEGHWYGKMDEDRIDLMLDALEEERAAEDLLLA
jgi:(2Fe-2S) ferredoxin